MRDKIKITVEIPPPEPEPLCACALCEETGPGWQFSIHVPETGFAACRRCDPPLPHKTLFRFRGLSSEWERIPWDLYYPVRAATITLVLLEQEIDRHASRNAVRVHA